MIHKISFQNGRGLTLRGIVSVPQKYDTAVIFLHGFPSNHQGFTASRLLPMFSRTNYLFLLFSFSHSSPSDGKFEDKLMGKEVADIKSAIDFLQKNYHFKKLVLMGHSTGAIDAALYAPRDPRVDKVILSGGVSDLKHAVRYDFTDQQVYDFWNKGYITYNAPGKWYHHKKLKKAFYDEFFTLDIPAALKKYHKPILILHGEKDEAVPVKEAHELFALANQPKRLVIIRDADHRFSEPKHFRKAMVQIKKFIEKN